MVQDQLVEYIKAQFKLGVSRDAVKTALVGAGWVAADVEDTLKKVEGDSKPAASAMATAKPASGPVVISAASGSAMGMNASMGAAVGAQKPLERSIKMSDLVSAGGPAAAAPSVAATASQKPAATSTDFFKGFSKNKTDTAVSAAAPVETVAHQPASRGKLVVIVVLALLVVGCGGAAGYFYTQNAALATKISSLTDQSAGVSSQISSLTSQVNALDSSNTALTAQVNSLTAQNTDLSTNLSFLAVAPGAATAAQDITLSGTLKQRSGSYVLVTSYGVTTYVKNSADPLVIAAMKPFVNSSSSVTLAGSHVPGSPFFTVTAVNGAAITAATPSVPTSAQSSSTPPASGGATQ